MRPEKPPDDGALMKEALRSASRSAERGEVPVGAVVVRDGEIIARGSNGPVAGHDPTAHAEIVAIRKAARKLGNYRLAGCDIFVTLEPCAMCLGAIVQARIRRLVFGAADPKAGAVASIMTFPFDKVNHRPEITAGVLEKECGLLLRDFFRRRR
jgi:tRNA(adenine34) deaminase